VGVERTRRPRSEGAMRPRLLEAPIPSAFSLTQCKIERTHSHQRVKTDDGWRFTSCPIAAFVPDYTRDCLLGPRKVGKRGRTAPYRLTPRGVGLETPAFVSARDRPHRHLLPFDGISRTVSVRCRFLPATISYFTRASVSDHGPRGAVMSPVALETRAACRKAGDQPAGATATRPRVRLRLHARVLAGSTAAPASEPWSTVALARL